MVTTLTYLLIRQMHHVYPQCQVFPNSKNDSTVRVNRFLYFLVTMILWICLHIDRSEQVCSKSGEELHSGVDVGEDGKIAIKK